MSYRIKFLESVSVDEITGEAKNITVSPAYEDGEQLDQMARNWKSIGLRRIIEIKLEGKNKLDEVGIVNKFYNEDTIKSASDQAVKEELLKIYGKKTGKAQESDESGSADVDTKELRESLYEKAKQLVKEGKLEKMPPRNVSTEKLADELAKFE